MWNILQKFTLALLIILLFILLSACSIKGIDDLGQIKNNNNTNEIENQNDNNENIINNDGQENNIESNDIEDSNKFDSEDIDIPPSVFIRSNIEGKSTIIRSAIGGDSSLERQIMETLTEFNAEEVGEDTMLTLPEDILFDFDSDKLRAEADEAIQQLVQVIESTDGDVTIIGHTDNHGEDNYNQKLSERRAQAVVEALIDSGIKKGRLKSEGKGSTDPVADNENSDGSDNPEGRQKNRRVEVIIHGFNS